MSFDMEELYEASLAALAEIRRLRAEVDEIVCGCSHPFAPYISESPDVCASCGLPRESRIHTGETYTKMAEEIMLR